MVEFLLTQEECFAVIVVKPRQLTQKDRGASSYGVTGNLAGHCPGWPRVPASASAEGCPRGSPEGPGVEWRRKESTECGWHQVCAGCKGLCAWAAELPTCQHNQIV